MYETMTKLSLFCHFFRFSLSLYLENTNFASKSGVKTPYIIFILTIINFNPKNVFTNLKKERSFTLTRLALPLRLEGCEWLAAVNHYLLLKLAPQASDAQTN